MTTSDSESLHSRADALTGLVCSFETRGTGVRTGRAPCAKLQAPLCCASSSYVSGPKPGHRVTISPSLAT